MTDSFAVTTLAPPSLFVTDDADEPEVTLVRRSLAPVALQGDDRVSRLEIDLDVIVDNARVVKVAIGAADLFPMLKADAYGHGITPVAQALETLPFVAGFVVTTVRDGLALRNDARIGKPIIVMTPFWGGRHEEVLQAGLTPVLTSTRDLKAFAQAAKRRRLHNVPVHVKLDSGMGRLGVREEELSGFLAQFREHASAKLVIEGLCTHLSSADAPPQMDKATNRQLATFERAAEHVRRAGHRPTAYHVANSAAVFGHPQAHFTHVRAGIALFGGDSGCEVEGGGARLRPALTWRTGIAQLRWIEAGERVSYGERWCAPRRTLVATLPIGYAHGYPRRFAHAPSVLVRGRRCPVIGRVCMEMLLVDVTDLAGLTHVGDDVVLIGEDGDDAIRVADLARDIADECIVEEIFCGLTSSRNDAARTYVTTVTRANNDNDCFFALLRD